MNGKKGLIALLALALVLFCGTLALAESDTVTKEGVTVTLNYTCKDEDGSPHTSHASITDVTITRTNVNQLRVDVSFRTYCDQNPNHGEYRSFWASFGRSSCTFPIRKTDQRDLADETRLLEITVDGVPHNWIAGRCIVCNDKCSHEGSTAKPTCTRGVNCSICGNFLLALGHVPVPDEGVEPTCETDGLTEGSHCNRCQTVLRAQEILPALGHNPVPDAGVEPTCETDGLTEGSHCDRCQTVLKEQEVLPALGHHYTSEIVEPTCKTEGCLRLTCARCGDTYTDHTVRELSHWFGEWLPNADDTHRAPCLRKGCKHTGKVDCQKYFYALTVENQEEPLKITLCPVCGELADGARLELEEKARAKAKTQSLPAGELVLRLGEPTEGVSLLSVAFELGGRLTQPKGWVEITLPASAVEGRALMLLDEAGGEMALPVEIQGNEAAFLLDFTHQEGEEPSPVRLIRLIPNP